jgi:hypothetical protein
MQPLSTTKALDTNCKHCYTMCKPSWPLANREHVFLIGFILASGG